MSRWGGGVSGRRAAAAAVALISVAGLAAGPASGSGSGADITLPWRVAALSVNLAGRPGNGVGGATASVDGCRVAFDTSNLILKAGSPYDDGDFGMYVRERGSDRTRVVSSDRAGHPAYGNYWGQVSGDGRYVVMVGSYSSLTPPGTDLSRWVLRKDLRTGRVETSRMPKASGSATGLPLSGAEVQAVSADGRLTAGEVWFMSADRHVVVSRIVVFDWVTHRWSMLGSYGAVRLLQAMSADGRYLAYTAADSAWDERELYLLDRKTGTTRHVGRGPAGTAARHYHTQISGDGRVLVTTWNRDIATYDMNVVVQRTSDLAVVNSVHDTWLGGATAVSYGARWVLLNFARADGSGRADVYRWDRQTGRRVLVSVTRDGRPPAGNSMGVAVTDDGATVIFTSHAGDIVPGDTPDDDVTTDTDIDVFAATTSAARRCG